ncbi:MAG: substrate-binding domain-containing protein [Blautia faecis]
MTDWRNLGLHAGKDMAVAGYDNREMACYEKPPLTTMALPLHDIGYKACQIIIGILTKEEVKLDNGNCLCGVYSMHPGVGERR